MRIGIIGLLHESNTFVQPPTTTENFRRSTLVEGAAVVENFRDAHHELGGFIGELLQAERDGVELAPIFAARALPSGTVCSEAFEELVGRMLKAVQMAGPLDGVLVAPHGATVSESFPDADGEWLYRLRRELGATPIVGTLDAHANLSAAMVQNCHALIAYRSNPHLDQRARGGEAARLLLRMLQDELCPQMAAVLPPLAINIEKQCTDEPQLRPLYDLADQQLAAGLLSNSVLLGFPYSDVAEMGSSVIAIGESGEQATRAALDLSNKMWDLRVGFVGSFVSPAEAVDRCLSSQHAGPTCLLDMGDNVGGGSAADGTFLLQELHRRRCPGYFVCLADPQAIADCEAKTAGSEFEISVGGKVDSHHGPPVSLRVRLVSRHDGKFSESKPRHGGMRDFDQGPTVVLETEYGSTIMLSTRRMTPFSLEQLRSCAIDPTRYQMLVAKGVNAPLAAYREVCTNFIRVNTAGSTCADMLQLSYDHRRQPMFPFDADLHWSPQADDVVLGYQS